MTNSSRGGAALIGFMAIGATLHCGAKQDGEVGIDDVGDAGGGTSVGITASCVSGSANQTGCACAQGAAVACYTGPASTRNVGTCTDGTQVCTEGALSVRSLHTGSLEPESITSDGYGYGPCTGEVLPTATATCGGSSTGAADGGGTTTSGGDSGAGGGTTTVPPASCPGPLTTWVPMSRVGGPPSLVAGPPLVWTGTEAIVFSGRDDNDETVDGGWLYNPATDTWREMSATNRPASRVGAAMLWTGTRFVVWGGERDTSGGSVATALADGALYDPVADTWEPIASTESQGLAEGPTAGSRALGWNGTELVTFGGAGRDGWFYNPATKGWRTFGGGLGVIGPSIVGTPSIELWTGTEAVEWGETMNPGTTAILAGYTDAAGTWKQLTASPLAARESADSVLAGDQIFVHGGRPLEPPYAYFDDGAMYNPATDTWTPLPAGGGAVGFAVTMWTGCDVLEIGGGGVDAVSAGMRYTPATGTWTTLPDLPERFINQPEGAVWAGNQVIMFGNGGNDIGDMFAYRLTQ